jgi:hypothetical protein
MCDLLALFAVVYNESRTTTSYTLKTKTSRQNHGFCTIAIAPNGTRTQAQSRFPNKVPQPPNCINHGCQSHPCGAHVRVCSNSKCSQQHLLHNVLHPSAVAVHHTVVTALAQLGCLRTCRRVRMASSSSWRRCHSSSPHGCTPEHKYKHMQEPCYPDVPLSTRSSICKSRVAQDSTHTVT